MNKLSLFAGFTCLLLASCSSRKSAGTSSAKETDAETTALVDTTQERFTIKDESIQLNANKTANEDFGRGILPDDVIKGERISHNFHPVYFKVNSADITLQEAPKLRRLAGYLESNPNLYLIIQGHCDEKGSDEYNRALSEKRALSVKKALEKYSKIIHVRVNTIGYGEERPADSADTPKAHAKNRRSEFVIISKR